MNFNGGDALVVLAGASYPGVAGSNPTVVNFLFIQFFIFFVILVLLEILSSHEVGYCPRPKVCAKFWLHLWTFSKTQKFVGDYSLVVLEEVSRVQTGRPGFKSPCGLF